MIYVLGRLTEPRSLAEFKVDSCLFQCPRTKAKRYKQTIESVNYGELHKLRERFEAPNCLDQFYSPTPLTSDLQCFRCAPVTDRDWMKTEPKLPYREPRAPVLSVPAWTDLTEEEARAHVLSGGSLCVSGQAGTGKSHFLMSVLRELEQSGKKTARCAKTHAASARIDGRTLDSFMRNTVRRAMSP